MARDCKGEMECMKNPDSYAFLWTLGRLWDNQYLMNQQGDKFESGMIMAKDDSITANPYTPGHAGPS